MTTRTQIIEGLRSAKHFHKLGCWGDAIQYECDCGTRKHNAAIDAAIAELEKPEHNEDCDLSFPCTCGIKKPESVQAEPSDELVNAISGLCQLMRVVPSGMPMPDVGVDSDGMISVDWMSGKNYLSICLSKDNKKLFFALLTEAGTKSHGSEVFDGETLPIPIGAAFNVAIDWYRNQQAPKPADKEQS